MLKIMAVFIVLLALVGCGRMQKPPRDVVTEPAVHETTDTDQQEAPVEVLPGEGSEPSAVVSEAVETSDPSYEALAEKSKPHAEAYLALKETDPEGALAALKKGLRILYENHPKTDVYAELLVEMDTAGEATHPQILILSELVLEMSMDNGYPKAVIEHLRASIEETQANIDALKAEGIDPDTVTFGFEFDPTQ